MMALFVWWFALPTVARRLIGIGLGIAALAATIASVVHHERSVGYGRGYARATDSVNAVAIARIAKAETVHVHVADSNASQAQHTDSLIAAKPRPRLVIQTVPLSVVRDSIQPELTVRVIVADRDTVENVPLRAARYWSASDSIASLAIQSAGQWHAAYTAEHDARIGADSLSSLWRARALAVQPEPTTHGRMASVWRWTERALLFGGGVYLGRRMR